MPFLIALAARWGVPQGLARVLGVVVPLVLVGALVAFLWLRGDHFRDQRDTARAQVQAVNARLAVSNASIASLQTVIEQRNAEIQQRADDYAAEKKQAAEDNAKLAKLAKGTDARIARVEAVKGDGTCPAPDELLSELGGI